MDMAKGCLFWSTVLLSFSCLLIGGLNLSFNVYALQLKETFRLSHTQMEIVASTNSLGLGLTIFEALISGGFGYRATFIISYFLLTGSSGGLSLITYYSDSFLGKPYYLYLVHFLLAFGNGISTNCIIALNVNFFPPEHTGKLIGLQNAALCFTKVILGGVMQIFFSKSLSSFFFMICVSSAVFYGIGYILLYKTMTPSGEDNDRDNPTTSLIKMTEKVDVVTIFLSKFFHLTFWSAVSFYSCAFTVMANITSMAESEGVENPITTVYMLAAVIVTSRVMFGFVFDRFSTERCGLSILVTSYSSLTVAMAIGLYISGSTWKIYVISALSGIGMGTGMTISLSVLAVHFGKHNISLITGCFFACMAAFQVSIQLLVGALYDHQSDRLAGTQSWQCQGHKCFYWSYLILMILAFLCSIIQGLNLLSVSAGSIFCHNKA